MLRQPPRSGLLHLMYNLFLHSGVLAIPGLMIPTGCGTRSEPQQEITAPPPAAKDSIDLNIRLVADQSLADASGSLRVADIFVYEAGELQRLLAHRRVFSDLAVLKLEDSGELTVAVIANSPYAFNPEAVGRYESLEQTVYSEKDDSPQWPLMSGTAGVSPGHGSVQVRLSRLGCRVAIAELSNRTDGVSVMEDVRVGLCSRNPKADIMRESGFRPAEPATDTLWAVASMTVGTKPVRPGITLYCLPSDSEEQTIGTPRTELVMECIINSNGSRTHHVSGAPLPPLRRGCTIMAEIELGPDGVCSYGFF